MTQDYYGTKRITAWSDSKDGKEGYAVKYTDGYISWSPKEVFESAYQPLNQLSFGHAIEALKAGEKVTRSGWNGKGMFLYHVPANAYPAQTAIAKKHWGEDAKVPYRAYIAMKTVDNDVQVWTASQTDVLANDWMILPASDGAKLAA